jgi:excisionase family DNA binding protein
MRRRLESVYGHRIRKSTAPDRGSITAGTDRGCHSTPGEPLGAAGRTRGLLQWITAIRYRWAPISASPSKGTEPMTGPAQPERPEHRDFFTVGETARHLRLCEKQVRRLIWRGELPAFRFGTALRITKADIAAYVAARRITPVIRQRKKGS